MLTNPNATFYYGGVQNPVPANMWSQFSTKAQAAKVFALAMLNFGLQTGAKLQLVSGTQTGQTNGFIILPARNPKGIDVWLMQGTVPGLDAKGNAITVTVNEWCGSLFDRGPASEGFGGQPGEADSNGLEGGLGGPFLTYSNADGADSEFRWSATQTPVLQDIEAGA